MDVKVQEFLKCLGKKAEETTDMIIDGTSLAQRFYFPDKVIIGKKVVVIPIEVLRRINEEE